MALDGAFLYFLRKEIEEKALQTRVEKIYQPSKEEIVLLMRGREGAGQLLISVNANSPRIHFTEYAPENPQTPPMFCMLMRKRLSGARLVSLRQNGLERILFLDFDATNELGDIVQITLCVEIMARHSNLILIDKKGKIIDSLKRVDETKSSVREILPGVTYHLPPAQDKIDLTRNEAGSVVEAVKNESGITLSKALQFHMQGASPIVCRELAYSSCGGENKAVDDLTSEDIDRLLQNLKNIKSMLNGGGIKPVIVYDMQEKPIDYSYMDITQYGRSAKIRRFETLSEVLDAFYYERDRLERIKNRSHNLIKQLENLTERTSRKLNMQHIELKNCEDREKLKISGDLINANLYRLSKGSLYYDIENFYEKNSPTVRIKADPLLTPSQNAQKYYKRYRKARTAEEMLTDQIKQGEQELDYIETVLDAISRADTEKELSEIKHELISEGYLTDKRGKKQKMSKPLPPIEFLSDDGFKILVGRNNVQNDRLTLHEASKSDIWLHTKIIPGSHVIIETQGKQPPDRTIEQAAVLAAYHSHARESSQVPVDFTSVRNVKKPQGAKPGKVIYVNYKTAFVTPDRELAERLAVKK